MAIETCACGKKLHYSDPEKEKMVQSLSRRLGEHVEVTVRGRTWLVQRHFIALHGLKAERIPELGFKEITHEVHT